MLAGTTAATERSHRMRDTDPSPTRRCRVLVIGETGSGKSTTINALAGKEVVATSDGANGCTDNYKTVSFTRLGVAYEFIDTIGLNEVTTGTVDQAMALKNFFTFLRDNKDGFNLIIFCLKRDRLTKQAQATYNVMIKKLYSQAPTTPPPVLLFVGGMFVEQEEPQDWCRDNREAFVDAGFEEAQDTLDGLHCFSLPSKSPNPQLDTIYKDIRMESTRRAWKLVEARACPELRPFYSTSSGMVRLGMTMWNMFVDLCAYIPSPFGGTLKDAFGLVKTVPQTVRQLVQGLGMSVEEFMQAWDEGF